MPQNKIQIYVTGGTFDKEYNYITGELYFKDTHLHQMFERGRSTLNVDIKTLSKLKYTLEEDTKLPYFFDIVIYDNLDNLELKKHIDEFGGKLFI